MLHANFTAPCFIELELLLTEVIHCINSDEWRPIYSYDTLTRLLSYMNVTHTSKRYTRYAKMSFLHQGFWKLSSDRHTDGQTETTKIIYQATLWVVNNPLLEQYWILYYKWACAFQTLRHQVNSMTGTNSPGTKQCSAQQLSKFPERRTESA